MNKYVYTTLRTVQNSCHIIFMQTYKRRGKHEKKHPFTVILTDDNK